MKSANTPIFTAFVCAACCVAGCGKKSGENNKPEGDAKPAAAAKASVTCASLPGAARRELRAADGGKTLHYIEVGRGKSEKGAPERTFSVAALDVAARTAKTVAEKVGVDAAAGPGGRFVFTRQEDKDKYGITTVKRLYAVAAGQATPTRLSPEDLDVTSFALDEASGMVIFAGGQYVPDGIYKVPLAGGQAEKIGEGREVIAVLKGEGAALINAGLGELTRQPLAGGAATPVSLERGRWILGVSQGYVITKEKVSSTPKVFASRIGAAGAAPAAPGSAAPSGSAAPGAAAAGAGDGALPIAVGAREVMAREAADALYITALEGRGEGEAYAVYKVEGPKTTKVLAARGVEITGVAGLPGGALAVLARNDTNGNGSFDLDDEVDVCFVSGAAADEVVAFPARSAPLRFKEAAQKLGAILTEPDLAGGKLRFETDDNGTERLIIDSPASGPTELGALRARVRAVQARVTEISGVPALEVSLRFAGNGRRADSSWDADTKRFLSSGGVGTALAPEPSEYKLEVYPKVKTTVRIDASGGLSRIGSAVCSGTVKNVGDQPIADIDVTCSNKLRFMDKSGEGKGKVTPATLAPGASGTYSVTIDIADADGSFETAFVSGGAKMPFFNSYFSGRAAEISDAAARVLDATGLAYVAHRTERGSREATRTVTVRASKAFADAADDAKEARAAQAAKDLGAALAVKDDKEDAAVPIVLNVYPEGGARLGWTFEGGKLKKSEDL